MADLVVMIWVAVGISFVLIGALGVRLAQYRLALPVPIVVLKPVRVSAGPPMNAL